MLDGILLPGNGWPVAGFLIVIAAPLFVVRPLKSPASSAAVGTVVDVDCGCLSVYFSPANQKNVLFLKIGPPKPPPPSRQISGLFGNPDTFGISNCSTIDVGRYTA